MKLFGKICSALMFVFLYAPIAVMIFFSFNSSRSTYVFENFSLKWYGELFNSSATLNALKNTLILAVLSALIATILGTLAAVGIFNMRSKIGKSAIMTTTNIPMMNPDVVTGVSMMLLFVFIGRLIGAQQYLSFYTILIAHITFNLPYVILNVLPKLRQTDKNLVEAAQDLGCTPHSAFYKVVLPNISSGIVSGFIMAFTLSLDDFVISYFTNGTGFQTLPLLIYNQTTKKTVKPDIYALSSVIFFAILILLIIVNLIQARSEMKMKKSAKAGLISKLAGKIGDWFDNKFETRPARLSVISGILVVCITLSAFAINSLQNKQNDKYSDLFNNLAGTYTTDYAGTELNVFNWGEYISDGDEGTLDVIDAFE
ncbi:MAG: ABC transporter permease, partial [Clostridia bacterium]|nr:ABC transporter permease [Clostridia bacterium]